MSEGPRIWEWLPGVGRNSDFAVTHFADEVGASLSEQNAKHETTEEEEKVRGARRWVADVQFCEGQDLSQGKIETQGLLLAGQWYKRSL